MDLSRRPTDAAGGPGAGSVLLDVLRPPPAVFGYAPPCSAAELARWQAQLDHAVGYRPNLSRLLLRWEAGDPWEPIGRWVLWQALDPTRANVEPWLVKAVKGPSPRSRGHWCGEGYCLCRTPREAWVQGATRVVDTAAWRLYRETGYVGTRWWVIQGQFGGHRFQLDRELDALEMRLRVQKGMPADTPAAGALPYAPFDNRVIDAIQRYRRAVDCFRALDHAERTGKIMDGEEAEQATAAAEALWEWTGLQAEQLWHEGAELVPRYLEEQYGRVPVHRRAEIAARSDPERVHEAFITADD